MNASDLTTLLARVEAAEGPDRELDARLSAHFERVGISYGFGDDEGWAPQDIVERWDDDKWAKVGRELSIGHARYTASLDAALALCERVLLPNLLGIEGSWEPRDKGVWPAWSVRWYPPGTDRDGKSWHAQVGSARTPALALLAALLRAKIAEASHDQ